MAPRREPGPKPRRGHATFKRGHRCRARASDELLALLLLRARLVCLLELRHRDPRDDLTYVRHALTAEVELRNIRRGTTRRRRLLEEYGFWRELLRARP